MFDRTSRDRNRNTALYATTEVLDNGQRITFRIGLPTSWARAHARWARLYPAANRAARVRFARRWYSIAHYEVRHVDRHGIGLGSERHGRAIPVPARAADAGSVR